MCVKFALALADRRAVDMPVKEPPVTTTVAIPGAKVEEVTWDPCESDSVEISFFLGWQKHFSHVFLPGDPAEESR